MSTFDNAVSIHPYFKIQPGQMEACKTLLRQFVEKVANEENCLYYNFTFHGDTLFCREAYRNAAGLQEHVANCGPQLETLLGISEVIRMEIHGPAAELEKLKTDFADFNPDYYELEIGIGR